MCCCVQLFLLQINIHTIHAYYNLLTKKDKFAQQRSGGKGIFHDSQNRRYYILAKNGEDPIELLWLPFFVVLMNIWEYESALSLHSIYYHHSALPKLCWMIKGCVMRRIKKKCKEEEEQQCLHLEQSLEWATTTFDNAYHSHITAAKKKSQLAASIPCERECYVSLKYVTSVCNMHGYIYFHVTIHIVH